MKSQPDQTAVPLGVATDSPLACSRQSNAGPTASPPETMYSAALRIAALNSLPSQIVVVDPAGIILSFNKSWRDFYGANSAVSGGASHGAEIGDNFLAVFGARPGYIPSESNVRAEQGIRAVLRDPQLRFQFEASCDTPTGSQWLLVEVSSLFSNHQGAVIAYTDITKRKELEQRLEESEGRYRSLFERATEGIFFLSADGTLSFVNQAFARMHGYSLEDMELISLKDLDTPSSAALAPERIRRLLAGEGLVFETEHYHKDGHIIPLEVLASLSTINGKCLIQCFHRDLTERKRAEVDKAKREELNQQLQKSESLGRMAGGIAHHFNNQLQVVMLNLQMAQSNRPGKAAPDRELAAAMQASHKAAEISSQLLTYIGSAPASKEPLNLAEICRQGLERLKATLPPSVVLEIDLPLSGPGVWANAKQIDKVLMKLITNAWESINNRPGSIRLSVKRASAAEILAEEHFPLDWKPQATAYACIEVADTGAGIAVAEIPKIFDPFYSTKFTGRGLGLPLVLGIARTHDGAVTVKSELGRGSVFRVYFPALAEDLPTRLVPVELAPAPPPKRGAPTVLVVDDEPVLRETLVLALELSDFNVLAAGDGVEAMELFRQHRDEIECVLCDVDMPRMNGWETLSALRQLAPQLPVILVSGHEKVHVMQGDHAERPQAFLKKPFELAACLDAIRLLTIPKE